MPDSALLINAARGKVADTERWGRADLRPAASRVGRGGPEPLPQAHPLWRVSNLILTPHAAGHIKQAGPRAFALVNDQLRRYMSLGTADQHRRGDY